MHVRSLASRTTPFFYPPSERPSRSLGGCLFVRLGCERPLLYEGWPGDRSGNHSAIDFDCASYVTRNTMVIRGNVDGCALAEAACVPKGTSLKLG